MKRFFNWQTMGIYLNQLSNCKNYLTAGILNEKGFQNIETLLVTASGFKPETF